MTTLLVALPAAANEQPQSAANERNGGWLAYTDHSTAVGLGIDQDGKLSAELRHVLNAGPSSGLIGEAWLEERAGGVKLTYNWMPADSEGRPDRERAIRRAFAAIDQNRRDDRKLSLGGGLENRDGFLAAYLSHALSDRRTLSSRLESSTDTQSGIDDQGRPYLDTIVTTTATDRYEQAFDWGIGIRAGRYIQDRQLRLALGADFEWGDNDARQTSFSLEAEKFFPGSPWSVTLRGEFLSRDDAGQGQDDDGRAWLILRRSFGDVPRRPTTYPIAISPAGAGPLPTPAAAVPPSVAHAAPATAAWQAPDTPTAGGATPPMQTAGGAGEAAVAPIGTTRTEKRLVKTTVSMYTDTHFKFDSAKILPEAILELDQMLQVLSRNGFRAPITLTGHTCDIGTEAYNERLSLRRADAVRKYLVDSGGVAAQSIVVVGKGEREPKYPNTRAERYKNRRVDMEFLGNLDKEEFYQVEVPATPAATDPGAGAAAPRLATADAAGTAGSAAPAVARGEARPASVPAGRPALVVQREIIELESDWIQYGLLNTIPHKRTVDTYQTTRVRVGSSSARAFTNRAPVAGDDSYTLTSLAPISLTVLANDSDPDGDALNIEAVSQPQSGSVAIAGGVLVYTPGATSSSGTQNFTYTVNDGKGGKVTANVTILLSLTANRAPGAADDLFRIPGTSPSLLDVLANDSDPDGDPLTILSYSQPGTGSVSLSGSNFLFTPFSPFRVTTFTYTVSDGRGGTDTATVTLVDP